MPLAAVLMGNVVIVLDYISYTSIRIWALGSLVCILRVRSTHTRHIRVRVYVFENTQAQCGCVNWLQRACSVFDDPADASQLQVLSGLHVRPRRAPPRAHLRGYRAAHCALRAQSARARHLTFRVRARPTANCANCMLRFSVLYDARVDIATRGFRLATAAFFTVTCVYITFIPHRCHPPPAPHATRSPLSLSLSLSTS